MNKLLLAVLVLVSLTMSLSAATITATCVPNPAFYPSGTAGGGTENCSFAGLPGGSTISAITAQYGFDFTFNAGDTSAKTVTFGFDAPGTSADWLGQTVTNLTRPVNSPTFNVSAGDLALYTGGGGFSIVDSYSQTAGTGVAGGIFNKTITATYTTSGTPEPTSISLLGLGLAAIGLGARKFRK